jgi:hypothetical protein
MILFSPSQAPNGGDVVASRGLTSRGVDRHVWDGADPIPDVAPFRGLRQFRCCRDPGAYATRLYDIAPFGAEKATRPPLENQNASAVHYK